MVEEVCTTPPKGWKCTRAAGHEGPCCPKRAKHPCVDFLIMFAVQYVQYLLFCVGIIFLNKGSYPGTFFSDTIYGLNTYFIIRRIATDDSTKAGMFGYIIGGACGSVTSIFLTKTLGVMH